MNRILIIILAVSLILFVSCEATKESAAGNTKGKTSETTTKKMTKSTAETTSSSLDKKTENPMNKDFSDLKAPTLDEVGDPSEVAVIETEKGNIIVEFFPDLAPLHVANFKKLARAGFYDGTTFHRVMPGFVIQGGDPNSKNDNPNDDGTGGPPYRVKAEFSDYKHEKGVLSMARSGDPNSAGSQFFICLGRAQHLDNKYSVFGKVLKGIEAVEKIGMLRRDPSNRHDRALPAIKMNKVYIINKSEIDKIPM